jgi:hypothetical protein
VAGVAQADGWWGGRTTPVGFGGGRTTPKRPKNKTKQKVRGLGVAFGVIRAPQNPNFFFVLVSRHFRGGFDHPIRLIWRWPSHPKPLTFFFCCFVFWPFGVVRPPQIGQGGGPATPLANNGVAGRPLGQRRLPLKLFFCFNIFYF